jgi:hypothetical protein
MKPLIGAAAFRLSGSTHRRDDEDDDDDGLGCVETKRKKTYSAKVEALTSRMLLLAMRGAGRTSWGSLSG